MKHILIMIIIYRWWYIQSVGNIRVSVVSSEKIVN